MLATAFTFPDCSNHWLCQAVEGVFGGDRAIWNFGLNWFLGSAWEPMSRGSASRDEGKILSVNWFLGSAWELMSRGSASMVAKNWRQSLRICVTRQSLGTSKFQQQARCLFHKRLILCGTGILPVLENITISQINPTLQQVWALRKSKNHRPFSYSEKLPGLL